MAFWIDLKYLSMLSSQLPQYQVKSSSPFKAFSRCPVCGDSKKNLYKKRFHLYQHKDCILAKCFNCGITRNMKSLLSEFNPELRKEYDLECFTDNNSSNRETEKPVAEQYILKPKRDDYLKGLKKISQLPVGHPAKAYVESRGIPSSQHFRLYYVPKFFAWTNSIIPDKFNLKNGDEPRLLIPFFDQYGNMFGYQGRTFDPNNELRYITIMIDSDMTKIYGLDQWKRDQKTYLVEGPLDSLFIPNCLAMAGSDVIFDFLDKNNTVICFDNESRNVQIVNKIRIVIEGDYSVCIWPNDLTHKDINDMVNNNMNPKAIIDANTYRGPMAKLRFGAWQKVGDLGRELRLGWRRK